MQVRCLFLHKYINFEDGDGLLDICSRTMGLGNPALEYSE
jgi:hypothetical protein